MTANSYDISLLYQAHITTHNSELFSFHHGPLDGGEELAVQGLSRKILRVCKILAAEQLGMKLVDWRGNLFIPSTTCFSQHEVTMEQCDQIWPNFTTLVRF